MIKLKVIRKDRSHFLYWYDKANGTVETVNPGGTTTPRQKIESDDDFLDYTGI